MKKFGAVLSLSFIFFGYNVEAKAANLAIATCVEFTSCYTSQTPTPFTANLTSSDLGSLGLGTAKDLFVVQKSPFIIRLGSIEFLFTTTSGIISETLPEFNGPGSFDPAVLTVGSVLIPIDALSATVSGSFGNSSVPNSAAADVFFGITPSTVPLPGALPMFGAALLVMGACRFKKMRSKNALN